MDRMETRRAFLEFVLRSPMWASLGALACTGETGVFRGAADPALSANAASPSLIAAADQALDVFDFRAVAEHTLPPAHWGYLATGADGEATLRANEEAYARIYLRPRRLVDVTTVDTRTRLFDREWETPIVLAPVGSQQAFHDEGELASARAARSRRHLQLLSTVTSTAVESVNDARGEPVWYQLYPTSRWDVTQTLVRRAESAGCPAIVLTVDLPVISNRLTQERYARRDSRECAACHGTPDAPLRPRPMFEGLAVTDRDFETPGLTWEFLSRLRDLTKAKLLIKGVVTREDATRAMEGGVDGIIVSNHGGRAEESGRGTIDSLPEVVEAVGGRVPVLVDGGIRRGVDVMKAIARGATAVCIGRPYIWGLAAFGQAGVERVLDILRAELELAMRLAGTRSLHDIGPSTIGMR